MENDGSLDKLPGKEAASIKHQMARMHRNFEGLLEVEELPAAIFVIDVRNEEIAVREAHRLNIPCIGLVDTNSDPSLISHPIPGNDDASKSIRIVAEVITEAILNGKARQDTQQIQSGITPLIRAEFGEDQEDLEVTLPEGYEEIVSREDVAASAEDVSGSEEEPLAEDSENGAGADAEELKPDEPSDEASTDEDPSETEAEESDAEDSEKATEED